MADAVDLGATACVAAGVLVIVVGGGLARLADRVRGAAVKTLGGATLCDVCHKAEPQRGLWDPPSTPFRGINRHGRRQAPYHAIVGRDGGVSICDDLGARDWPRPPSFRVTVETLLALVGRTPLVAPASIPEDLRAQAREQVLAFIRSAPPPLDEAVRQDLVEKLYRETVFDRSLVEAVVDAHGGDVRGAIADLAVRAAYRLR